MVCMLMPATSLCIRFCWLVKTKFASSPLVYKLKHNLGLRERKYSASNPSLSRFNAQSLHTLVTQVTLAKS